MTVSSLWPYQSPGLHEVVSQIIRRHSTNPVDIRDAALAGLDLTSAHHVLDLGCGFGFMAATIAEHVARDARIVGVDAWASNKAPYLHKIADAARTGEFVCMRVENTLPWPDDCFDLVLCCYSLYFFVGVLPEVARVLRPSGLFLTVTHSEHRLAGHLPAAGFADAASGLVSLTQRFSAENGMKSLAPWFGKVDRIDYHNALRFGRADTEELRRYLHFKLPMLVPGAAAGDALPAGLEEYVDKTMRDHGEIVVEKNDAVFRCREPVCA
jgi:SAM-dependent methyltransferase